ncbi:MAG: hypothetical protein QOC59_418 [Microbacteriaceae bacterium]|nr:hypothetical protein [Microbacteriaceae bacterium]
MRSSAHNDVISAHLAKIRARRNDLRRILGGGAALMTPTVDERREFEAEYAGLGVVEQGLTTLLPADWRIGGESDRGVDPRTEAVVIGEARAAVAITALLAQQPEARSADRDRLPVANATFRYLQGEVQRLADDAAAAYAHRKDPPVPPSGPNEQRTVERMVAIGGWSNLIGGPS